MAMAPWRQCLALVGEQSSLWDRRGRAHRHRATPFDFPLVRGIGAGQGEPAGAGIVNPEGLAIPQPAVGRILAEGGSTFWVFLASGSPPVVSWSAVRPHPGRRSSSHAEALLEPPRGCRFFPTSDYGSSPLPAARARYCRQISSSLASPGGRRDFGRRRAASISAGLISSIGSGCRRATAANRAAHSLQPGGELVPRALVLAGCPLHPRGATGPLRFEQEQPLGRALDSSPRPQRATCAAARRRAAGTPSHGRSRFSVR